MQLNQSDLLWELQRLTWILANLVKPVTEAEMAPKITLSPGVADRGAWGCAVHINLDPNWVPREGSREPPHSKYGTIGDCVAWCRREIQERLGAGYI